MSELMSSFLCQYRALTLACASLLGMVLGAGLSTATAFDHAPLDQVLQQYVDDQGHVAYRRLAAYQRGALDAYLGTLATADPTGWDTKEQKAFWINAYNAGILDAVLQGYSAETFLSRASLFKRFTFTVAGKARTLDEIEHGIVRPQFRDPRTHFALVCASSSCPRLRRHAYTAATLDAALDEEARRFINDGNRNVLNPAARAVQLSSIFQWFADDFIAAAGSVPAYVARYVDSEAKRALLDTKPTDLTYLPYDWTLNAQNGERP
ncbi:MAG: DUF547 domain-containing protein [Gemmatimonadaceae bacterium]|nr:DUF547 domain-containing protein [Gemmatimonadaceae bacterium]